jgi:tRNA nucleotidyltransferase (CCA-adding enzyme)
MLESAKVVLSLLHKRNFEASFIGGKCRVDLHNEYHPTEKIELKDIDIVTNAQVEDIKSIFPNSDVRGESFQVVVVKFGGHEFEIATYRKDIYNSEDLKGDKIARPKTEVAKDLDEDRSRRDYTINAIAQDIEGNYNDYVYSYRNKKISSMRDIKDKLIRAIGNPKQRFEEDPLRIIRGFRFMSQLGYEIEKQTLKAMSNNLFLMEKIPHERISGEFNKLLVGKHVASTLKLMQEIGVFQLKVFNGIKNQNVVMLPALNTMAEEDFNVLETFNRNNLLLSHIEAWTVLLKQLGKDKAKENLESIYPISQVDIEKVEWLIDHFDLIDEEDYRNAIFKARDGIVDRMKLMCMRELLKRLCKIRTVLDPEYKDKAHKLIEDFCARPYFHEQLKVNGDELMTIANEKPGKWINTAKEKLLFKLINSNRFPKEQDKYMELVHESIEEALVEDMMGSK